MDRRTADHELDDAKGVGRRWATGDLPTTGSTIRDDGTPRTWVAVSMVATDTEDVTIGPRCAASAPAS
jgi:hypothetical protein